jgi:hypothetical protein
LLKILNIDLDQLLPVEGLAEERKSQLLSQAREVVQVRLTKKIDSLLSARDRRKLESLEGNPADAGKFLRNRLPALEIVVKGVLNEFQRDFSCWIDAAPCEES